MYKGLEGMNSSLTFVMTERWLWLTTQSRLPNDSRNVHYQAMVCVSSDILNDSFSKDRGMKAKRKYLSLSLLTLTSTEFTHCLNCMMRCTLISVVLAFAGCEHRKFFFFFYVIRVAL